MHTCSTNRDISISLSPALSRLCYLPPITRVITTLHSPLAVPLLPSAFFRTPIALSQTARTSLCHLNLPSSCLSSCHFLPHSLAPSSALSFILSTSCLFLFFLRERCVLIAPIFSLPVIPSPCLPLIPPSPAPSRIGLSHRALLQLTSTSYIYIPI